MAYFILVRGGRMFVIDTRMKLILFVMINFMVFGLKDFVLGSICFIAICLLVLLMGQKKRVCKYAIFYIVIVLIQEICSDAPQSIYSVV